LLPTLFVNAFFHNLNSKMPFNGDKCGLMEYSEFIFILTNFD
jgi:hypothetical protein